MVFKLKHRRVRQDGKSEGEEQLVGFGSVTAWCESKAIHFDILYAYSYSYDYLCAKAISECQPGIRNNRAAKET